MERYIGYSRFRKNYVNFMKLVNESLGGIFKGPENIEIELYRNTDFGSTKYYVTYTMDKNIYEGEIHIGSSLFAFSSTLGDYFKYISHVEWDGEEPTKEETEAVENYLKNNIDLIFNSEKI